jgi:predicted nucleotidyltransferase
MGLLHSPLDGVLGSITKVRLLRAIVPLTRPVALREAARLAGVSVAAAQAALQDLADLQIVERREATAQHLYRFNREHALAPPIEQLFGAEHGRRQAIIDSLAKKLRSKPARGVRSAAIFGSAARGDDRPGSDLDVLIIVRDVQSERQVQEAMADLGPVLERTQGLRLSPMILTIDELLRRARGGDPFVSEVVKDGMSVLGPSVESLLRQTRDG